METVLRAQFGEGFRRFGVMRRRRNELEYPAVPGEATTGVEAANAIADAREMVEAAHRLLPALGIY